MAATPAIDLLEQRNVPHVVHTYELASPDEPTYGEAVAVMLGIAPERAFKTLVAEVDGEPTVAIVPVAARLSPKKLARARAGKRAGMIDPSVAERLTGYVTGGISPFGQKRRLPTVIDDSVEGWDTVFVSGGRRGIQLEVAPADLIDLLGASVADLKT
jgi:Cys-tRNA(Pro)/Cys-tRNA(Cys) deacylase